MEQLELRSYDRKEIASILHVNPAPKNFKRDTENRLSRWGYQYVIVDRGPVIITGKPETPEDRLKEIMFRLFELDTQTGTNGEMDNGSTVFACHLHFMMTEEIAETMPWDERYAWLNENYGVTACPPCLQRWTNRLIAHDIMNKSSTGAMWWMTYYIDGVKHRVPVDETDPELINYREYKAKILPEMLRRTNGNVNTAYHLLEKCLWAVFHCRYYQCKCLQVNGLTDEDTETVLALVDKIVDDHFAALMKGQ